jgi:acyl carrier protein
MNENDIFLKSRDILEELTGLDSDEITLTSSLMEDLGIESFDLSDLNFKLKEVFEIKQEFDFLSIEGIVGNPDFLSEDNRLTAKGIEEMKKRIVDLEITNEMEKGGVSLVGILNQVTVQDMVNYIMNK